MVVFALALGGVHCYIGIIDEAFACLVIRWLAEYTAHARRDCCGPSANLNVATQTLSNVVTGVEKLFSALNVA